MRIPLSDGSRNETTLQFEPDRHHWLAPKNPDEGRCAIATKLPPPFDRLFIKRYRGKKAPAHALLTAAVGNRLPASTPRIYGWGRSGSDYIYVFEYLPPADYQTLNELLGTPDGVPFMTPDLMLRIARQSENLFTAIGRTPFEHVFTDYCTKNLMYNLKSGGLVFIDLDSAWPFPLLHEHENEPIGDKFDAYFWTFWLKYDLAKRNHRHHHLPLMMVLSFAATFGRALGLLRHREQPEAAPLLFTPAAFEQINQVPLWEALDARDEEKFRAFFCLSPRRNERDDLFDTWSAVFEDLTQSTAYVPWPRVREAVEALAQAQIEASRLAEPSFFPSLLDILDNKPSSGGHTRGRGIYEAIRRRFTQFSETEFWQELTAIWHAGRGYQRLNLVFLIHLFAGFGLTLLGAVTNIGAFPFLLIGGLVYGVSRRLRAFARDRLWDTAGERWWSVAGFGAAFVLPLGWTYIVLLLDLGLTCALILYTILYTRPGKP